MIFFRFGLPKEFLVNAPTIPRAAATPKSGKPNMSNSYRPTHVNFTLHKAVLDVPRSCWPQVLRRGNGWHFVHFIQSI